MRVNSRAKDAVRRLWIDEAGVRAAEGDSDETPLYLTLPGADGAEFRLLADAGILRLSEVGGIHADDAHRFIAVESSPDAVLNLQRKFPGLKILRAPIQNLVRGQSPTAWPDGDDVRICRARVINLDLNAPLVIEELSGQFTLPLITVVAKLAQLHAAPPPVNWTLCLTLHGQVNWTDGGCSMVQLYLRENFERDGTFGASCRLLLGDRLHDWVMQEQEVALAELTQEEQQRLLMTLVPKAIAHKAHAQGWHVSTERNLRYAGAGGAPMVTWILKFTWDKRTSKTPEKVYIESLRTIPIKAGSVERDGAIHERC